MSSTNATLELSRYSEAAPYSAAVLAPEYDRDSSQVAAWKLTFTWIAIAIVGGADWVWCRQLGIAFHDWTSVAFTLAILGAIAFFYTRVRPIQALADAGRYAAFWVAFSVVGAILTYLTASMNFPLRDAQLVRIDAAMGFHWVAWSRFILAHPLLRYTLRIAYAAMLPQIVLSILYFSVIERPDRNCELLWASMVSLIVTALLAGMVPALGPYVYLPGAHSSQLPALDIGASVTMILRNHTVSSFSLGAMQGIIVFPSFHTVMTILFLYTHRPPCRSAYLVVPLNTLMLFSIPFEGHHYAADLLSGAAIAAVSIVAARWMLGNPVSRRAPSIQVEA